MRRRQPGDHQVAGGPERPAGRRRRCKVSFLAVDSTGEHETGEPREETNPITSRYDYAYREARGG